MDPRPGYRPTRSYTVVRDATGDRLVARDDPQLAFNLLWLEQHDPAYRYREGGAAFGKLVRSLLKNAWRNYREDHAQQLAGAPDAEGNGSLERFSEDTDYRLRWSDDEVTIAVEYAF